MQGNLDLHKPVSNFCTGEEYEISNAPQGQEVP